MNNFTRRTYLKGGIAASGVLAGLGGTAAAIARQDGDEETDGEADGSEGEQTYQHCPAGTTELATYETDTEEFVFEEGEDVIEFSKVETDDGGNIVGFDWDSEELVAVLVVGFDDQTRLFQGGFDGKSVTVEDEDTEEKAPAIEYVDFCAPRGGRAALGELDMDHPGPDAFDTSMRYDGHPFGEDPEGVLRITSDTTLGRSFPEEDREETQDYAISMVNIQRQMDERLTLEEFSEISFEYFEGEANTSTGPGEVFVVLFPPDDDPVLAATSTSVETNGFDEIDVLDRINNDTWQVTENVQFQHDELRESDAFESLGTMLRDEPDGREVIGEAFEESVVVAVGVGAADTQNATIIDRYYENLAIKWNDQEETFDFPALFAVSVDELEDEDEYYDLTLSFEFPPEAITFDEAVSDTVKLNNFSTFAAPVEAGVRAESVEPDDTSVSVSFPRDEVDALDLTAGEDDEGVFIVSGDFDVPSGSSFFGVGTLE